MDNIAENSFDAIHSLKDQPLLWLINKISRMLEQEHKITRTNCCYIPSGIMADYKDNLTGAEYILEVRKK